jgi:GT2 family glycosyltransferase
MFQELGRLGEPHHQMLEMQSTRALASGDVAAAYRLSDRRCRIRPLPEAHSYVLRAEALNRMGERAAAIADLSTAIGIAPGDLAANRRMLVWAKGRQQIAAARTLIDCDSDTNILAHAIAVLRKTGQTAFARLEVCGRTIKGWAAWQSTDRIRITVTGETDSVESYPEADPVHPLSATLGHAVGFELPMLSSRTAQLISIARDDDVLVRLRASHAARPLRALQAKSAPVAIDASVTVIVPVYADYRATRACLQSLLDQFDRLGRHRIMVVNDASPDLRIQELLDDLAQRAPLRVLRNASNLGFVGTINRALDEVSSGDVILLNADTVVPPGFIERLATAARSSTDIGTVTPLSNNGEFTSFPIPNQANATGTATDVEKLDAIAARVNAGKVIDIPNGIGFCLYVTRACLDAVGGLSESYHRGYLEDVDFCLRARRHGFRNVCATSVYVGHAGSRSFGKHKRSLVVRNLEVIEQRFPAYRTECADFLLADPLKGARQAIEALMRHRPHATLLLSGSGVVAEIARERARQLLAGDAPAVLILEIRHAQGRTVARLYDAAGAAPQSLEFELPGQVTELCRFVQSSQPARFEFFDLARIPRAVAGGLLEIAVPYDVVIAHTELGLKPVPMQTWRIGGPALADIAADVFFWRGVVARADRVLVPDAQAEAVASTLALRRSTTRLATPTKAAAPARGGPNAATSLGLVPVYSSVRDHQFLRDVAARLRNLMPELRILVVGSTLDDSDLLRANIFVTGPVEPTELQALFRRHALDRILLCQTRALFGHPVPAAAMASGLPVAYVDWSRGQSPAREADLPLDPLLPAAAMVMHLAPWLQGAPSP